MSVETLSPFFDARSDFSDRNGGAGRPLHDRTRCQELDL